MLAELELEDLEHIAHDLALNRYHSQISRDLAAYNKYNLNELIGKL